MDPSLLVKQKPIFVGASAVFKYDKKIEAQMCVTTRFDDTVVLSRRVGDELHVPRELLVHDIDPAIDKRTTGSPVLYPKFQGLPPKHADQARVIREALKLLQNGKSHIIEASTGFGKTYIGTMLAKALGLKVLVVVTKEDLLGEGQWRGAFKKFTGVKDSDIGIIQQNKCQVEDKKVCLGMVHSLAKEKYPEWIYDEFGLVIFDEVHRMGADTFSIVAGLFNAKLRLGLSATPYRMDGKEFIFNAHLGDVQVIAKFIPVPPKVLVVETPYRLPYVNRPIHGAWKRVKLPHEAGKLGAVLTSMAKCQERNELIADLVVKAYAKKRWVVVGSDLARDKHLNILHGMIAARGVPVNDIAFFVGGMKEKDLDKAKGKRVVLATYQKVGEGTDVPWWDTMILATPRSNIMQIVGRILREWEGKLKPIVFDLVDTDSPVLVQYFNKRRQQYVSPEMGGEVVSVSA